MISAHEPQGKQFFVKNCPAASLYTASSFSFFAVIDSVPRPKEALSALPVPEAHASGTPLPYVSTSSFDPRNRLNAICLHIASQMFFIITVNLARYALTELSALRAGSHDTDDSTQSTAPRCISSWISCGSSQSLSSLSSLLSYPCA